MKRSQSSSPPSSDKSITKRARIQNVSKTKNSNEPTQPENATVSNAVELSLLPPHEPNQPPLVVEEADNVNLELTLYTGPGHANIIERNFIQQLDFIHLQPQENVVEPEGVNLELTLFTGPAPAAANDVMVERNFIQQLGEIQAHQHHEEVGGEETNVNLELNLGVNSLSPEASVDAAFANRSG